MQTYGCGRVFLGSGSINIPINQRESQQDMYTIKMNSKQTLELTAVLLVKFHRTGIQERATSNVKLLREDFSKKLVGCFVLNFFFCWT